MDFDTDDTADTRAKAQAHDDLRWLLADPRGRRAAWRLLETAGVFRISFLPGADPTLVAFREGERNVGLSLLGDLLSANPAGYAQMLMEKKDDA